MDLAERLLKEYPRERLVLSTVINHLDQHCCKEVRQNLVRYQESNSKISIEALCRTEKVASFRAAISAEPSLKNRMGFNNLPMDKVTMTMLFLIVTRALLLSTQGTEGLMVRFLRSGSWKARIVFTVEEDHRFHCLLPSRKMLIIVTF